jgi:hypothetical protein
LTDGGFKGRISLCHATLLSSLHHVGNCIPRNQNEVILFMPALIRQEQVLTLTT